MSDTSRPHTSRPNRAFDILTATELPHDQVGDATERWDVLDALHRFAAGQDLKDWALFASAFADDAQLDFTQPAARLGAQLPVLRGRGDIVAAITAAVQGLDTTHSVSNARIWVEGRHAQLLALVEAQHLPAGDHSRHLLLKNFYRVRLHAGEGRQWAMTHVRIDNAWMTGDASVLFPDVRGRDRPAPTATC
ncbi:nuclear transport factor 2 family protein [Caldimonas brevitalea]|uniref:SnoaL-like domain-containing protein n=1 Tax=Caldimonas brevitalea TaxID=413882 RepID=A0A0G3BR18_9BURK|nr:nuclear transport factor 2 family protein [Caldimonas brevitalea]AKJ31864.1 hypothetical protein AAW51_5173 [Caldimonas brevitalea]